MTILALSGYLKRRVCGASVRGAICYGGRYDCQKVICSCAIYWRICPENCANRYILYMILIASRFWMQRLTLAEAMVTGKTGEDLNERSNRHTIENVAA